jgi:CheY-like chemotaxis protein
MANVIFVDDEPPIRRTLVRRATRGHGLVAHAPSSLSELLELAEQNPSAVVVFDGNCAGAFEGLNGWDLVPLLRARGWTGEGVVFTGARDENIPAFRNAGLPAERVFDKPELSDLFQLLVELAK